MAGESQLDDARVERFRRLFAASGVPATTTIACARRRRPIARLPRRRAAPVAGALALLSRAQAARPDRHRVEQPAREQQDKLRLCGLRRHTSTRSSSRRRPASSKPDPAIFAMALERARRARAEDAVMVGDSWPADIEGARAAGIRAIWFNRDGACRRRSASADVARSPRWRRWTPSMTAIFGDDSLGSRGRRPVRIGIDLGGTKIEADRARRRRARAVSAAHSDAARRLRRRPSRPSRRSSRGRGGRRHVERRRRHARRRLAGDRAGQERQLDVVERPSARGRSRGAGSAARAARQRRQLLCAVRSDRRRRGRAAGRVRRDHRHRHRRRHRGQRPRRHRRQRHRRRVGPQPVAVARG